MSRFSIFLKELIESSDESISSIARSIHAERTSLHKALTDERILSYKVVRALANHFHLPLDEQKRFLELYNIRLQGEETYENRQAICSLLNDLSSISFSMTSTPPILNASHILSKSFYNGTFAIHNIILNAINYESANCVEAHFSFHIPDKLDLTRELMELWLNQRTFTVDTLINFRTGSPGNVKNIQRLESVIPLCLASKGNYHPYYYFEAPKTAYLSPMSYYIITDHYLILLAEDLSAAQVLTDEDLISFYRNYYRGLLESCEPLAHCNADIMDTLLEYDRGTPWDTLHVMMSQPCTGRYINPELIQKYMVSGPFPYKEMFLLVEQHFSRLGKISGDYQIVFTEEGLRELCKTRVMEDLPPEYALPLDAEDLQHMLSCLYREITDGSVKGMLLRSSKLRLPDYMVFYVHPQTGLRIYTTNAFVYGAYCCNIHITEESICRCFCDFMEHLDKSGLIYSKEETLQILADQMAGLNEGKKEGK